MSLRLLQRLYSVLSQSQQPNQVMTKYCFPHLQRVR